MRAFPLKTFTAIFILLLACATLSTVYAQSSAATIVGTVTDDSGAVIPNANVTVRSLGTGQERAVVRVGWRTVEVDKRDAVAFARHNDQGRV